jgi:CAAX protease family protein
LTEEAVQTSRPTASFRAVSAAELLFGAFLIIGHNVFRIVPNEVLILAALGLASARLRNGGITALGLRRPESWRRIILIALAAAGLRIILGDLVIEPLVSNIWPAPVAPAGADEIKGNFGMAGLALLLVWSFAAFGEEIGYRGYLLTRAAEAGGGSGAAYLVAVVITSVLFGYGHYYKGPAGVVDSGVAGLVLGTAYLCARRNLWVCILAHGFIDTFAVVVTYLGIAD